MVVVIDHHRHIREHYEPQEKEEIVTMMEKGQGKEDETRDPHGEVGEREEKKMNKRMMMREWLTRTS